jgi:hypothetical protein
MREVPKLVTLIAGSFSCNAGVGVGVARRGRQAVSGWVGVALILPPVTPLRLLLASLPAQGYSPPLPLPVYTENYAFS